MMDYWTILRSIVLTAMPEARTEEVEWAVMNLNGLPLLPNTVIRERIEERRKGR